MEYGVLNTGVLYRGMLCTSWVVLCRSVPCAHVGLSEVWGRLCALAHTLSTSSSKRASNAMYYLSSTSLAPILYCDLLNSFARVAAAAALEHRCDRTPGQSSHVQRSNNNKFDTSNQTQKSRQELSSASGCPQTHWDEVHLNLYGTHHTWHATMADSMTIGLFFFLSFLQQSVLGYWYPNTSRTPRPELEKGIK